MSRLVTACSGHHLTTPRGGRLEGAAGGASGMAPLAQVNPLSAYRGGIASLFSTHPSTEERIARLQAIARGERPL